MSGSVASGVCWGSLSRPRFSSPSSFSSGTAEVQGLGWKARGGFEAARSSPSVLKSALRC